MEALAIDITEEGQMTIPAEELRRLNWTPGKKLFLQVVDDDCEGETGINPFTGQPHAPYIGIEAAVRQYVAKYGRDGRTTDEIMKELREGEQE